MRRTIFRLAALVAVTGDGVVPHAEPGEQRVQPLFA